MTWVTCVLYQPEEVMNIFSADGMHRLWTDLHDYYFEYLTISFEYLIIPFYYLIFV